MASTPASPNLDEDKYRTEVLGFDSAEAEQARAQQLTDEAHQLGLKVPEIEVSAPVAASIASGMGDLASPLLSSGSSTDRNSTYEGSITPSHEPSSPTQSPLDQVTSSLSEITIASERAKPGSTRSLVSLSTRPTSYCSSESRAVVGGLGYDGLAVHPNRNSVLSVASAEKQEKRRRSLKEALGRFHFRRKRPYSNLILPPDAQVSVARNDDGVERVYIEEPPVPATTDGESAEGCVNEPQSQVEIPIFDKESLQRSLDDPELGEMLGRHLMERNRHLLFQEATLNHLRRRHQIAITERRSDHERQEEEKRDKNINDLGEIEERQLAREIEQQREFERAKMNSRTRIKYMEGYFQTTSPPPSPATANTEQDESSESFFDPEKTPPPRRFTQQQKEQLEQEYHVHESMDALHEARIKVLRDRQENKLQEAMARLERELNTLCTQNVKSISALQTEHRNEETSTIKAFDTKKAELRRRWDLEEAILRRQLEDRNGLPYGPLPPISFNAVDSETRDSTLSVSEHSPVTPTTPS
ncbi:hypothetical protein N7492_007619 [Penicillium capsulatum]|uniref:Uncharacterized protein n=1 Tax=Penicillium capsulatum TaxID=69766 RepID=A0A9W9LL09_9EURO|nr:hypothetical protein N7492_007619 [Penicillium capsulatum]KAJ6117454.1 hypothetical protein N7512_007179 [Penicillium capsulatum]